MEQPDTSLISQKILATEDLEHRITTMLAFLTEKAAGG